MATAVTPNSTPSLNAVSPSRFLISELCELLDTYLEPAQVKHVYNAYLFSAEAHEGQKRLTGEPYIYHPLAVAKIMAEMQLDYQSITAAILHDVIEDTPTAKEQIKEKFGEDVAELVDGVSKLTHLTFSSRAEAQAENFRKMMLAMVRDIRIIIVKLADRLHNLRTIGVMRSEKKRRIAKETLDIYVPIAQRLGMHTIRVELEHLAFQAMHPLRYGALQNAVNKSQKNRKKIMREVETSICTQLENANIESRIFGREKNLYSIYKKMRAKSISFSEVYDVYAIRLLVKDIDTCYRTMGVVHNLYKPVPGKFKDYIAIPKKNGYQSLHTILFGPKGVVIEIQIRTEEMDVIAESGVAAHWIYKSQDGQAGTLSSPASTQKWVADIMEIQQNTGNSLEFLESVKIDLFPDEIYVFTPAGDIIVLPRGSSAVDFAYAVHSDLGNTCVAVKVDRRISPLSIRLENGQTIEVISTPTARPKTSWLNFVTTNKARVNIRHYLKNLQKEEATKLGERLFKKSFSIYNRSFDQVKKRDIKKLLESTNLASLEELYAEIGIGERVAELMIQSLLGIEEVKPKRKKKSDKVIPLAIRGTEGVVVNFGKCCSPIPGDQIIGIMTSGKGLVIHRERCRNIDRKNAFKDKWVTVSWAEDHEQDFVATVRVETINQRGVLATLAARIAAAGSNIDDIVFEDKDDKSTTITFAIGVRDRKQLASIIRTLRSNPNVLKASRMRG
ncbi:MAG: bifunctional (p)ppGpp synthetase/guanosine-3',5'-bis(diphosphate) 3'-pyrophosphohydrolase [Gammaproteobacteria bacterium]